MASKEDPKDLRQLQLKLRRYIGCPIDWSLIADKCDEVMIYGLRLLWRQVAERHQVDSEMSTYTATDFLTRGLAIDIDAMAANDRYWRKNAEDEYRRKTEFLAQLKFKPPDETRHKHHPRQALSREIVIERSRSNSLFFSDTTMQRIEVAMWAGIQQAWLHLVNDRPLHLFVEAEDALGASEGKATVLIRFDIDYSNAEVHAHPRLQANGRIYREDAYDFPDLGEDAWQMSETIDDDFELS